MIRHVKIKAKNLRTVHMKLKKSLGLLKQNKKTRSGHCYRGQHSSGISHQGTPTY